MQLYPFQAEGVSELVRRRCILLADEMGLGKTVQAVVALQTLFRSGAIRRVLIVCPASLCHNWRREIFIWGQGLPAVLYEGADRFGMLQGNAPVLIGSYETIADDLRRTTRDGDLFHDTGIDVLILDEAQRIKSPESLKARVLSRIMSARRWAITGTPLENHPRELASVMRFLFPNEFESKESWEDYPQLMAMRDLSMVRRTKAQVGLELPPKTVASVYVALTPDQSAEYMHALSETKAFLSECRSHGEAVAPLLSGLQRLRRIAIISSNGESSKLDLICEEVSEVVKQGQKVVVFSSFPNLVLRPAVRRLSRWGALLYTGSMSGEDRVRVHDQFVSDPEARIMCASIRSAGVGLSWTSANVVYQTDIWWNPQVLRQAEDRLHRIGQVNPVLVKRLVSEGTIEVAVEGVVSAKEEIFKVFIDEQAIPSVDSSNFESLLSLIGMKLGDLKGSATRRRAARR